MTAKRISSKQSRKQGLSTDVQRWQQLCADLREERDRLHQEVAKLKTERDQYVKAIYALTWEDFDIDKKALLAQLGKGQSLEDLIAELESQGVS